MTDNGYPEYREGDYSPDRQYRLHNGGWIPAAEYPVTPLDHDYSTPWYKRKETVTLAVVGGVLALIAVGFAAGNGNDPDFKVDINASSQDEPTPTKKATPKPTPTKSSVPPYISKIPGCLATFEQAADLISEGGELAGDGAGGGFLGNELEYSIDFFTLSLRADTLVGEIEDACSGIPGADDMQESVSLWGDSWYEISEAMDDFFLGDYDEASAHMEEANRLSSKATDAAERANQQANAVLS